MCKMCLINRPPLRNDPLSNVWPENVAKEILKGGQMKRDEKKVTFWKKETAPGSKKNWRYAADSKRGSPRTVRLGEKQKILENGSYNKVIPESLRGEQTNRSTLQYTREFLLQLKNDPISNARPQNLSMEYMKGGKLGKYGKKFCDPTKKPTSGCQEENWRCGLNKKIQGENTEGRWENWISVSSRGENIVEDKSGLGVKRGREKKSPAMLTRDAKRREAFLMGKKWHENVAAQHEENLEDGKEKDHSSFTDVMIMVTDTTEDFKKMEKDKIATERIDLKIVDKVHEEQETSNPKDVEKRKNGKSVYSNWDEVVYFMVYFLLQVWRKVSRTVEELTSKARIQDIYIPKEWL